MSSSSLACALSSLGRASVADRVDAGAASGAAAAAAGLATTSTTLSSPSLPSLESSITIKGTEGDMGASYSFTCMYVRTSEQGWCHYSKQRSHRQHLGNCMVLMMIHFASCGLLFFVPHSSVRNTLNPTDVSLEQEKLEWKAEKAPMERKSNNSFANEGLASRLNAFR